MQPKRGRSPAKFLLWTAVIAIGGGIAILLLASAPAPTAPVEKELDSKAFLEPKQ